MNIEIFSDLVCPWCFIGKRRLDLALQTSAGDGVKIIWRAYQLYPGLPAAGMDRREFMKLRYGDQTAGRSAAGEQIATAAAALGIDMDTSAISRMPNTFNGHRLLHRARSFGLQHELADSLFSAYFEKGRDIGSNAVLAAVAREHGMAEDETIDYLESDAGVGEVTDELTRAQNVGVNGVPCFLLAGAFALPGAQEPEVMAQIIERARSRLAEAS